MPAVTIKRVRVTAWACECARCGHAWKSLEAEAPTRCPRCKTRGFSAAPRWRRPDRTSRALAKKNK